MLERLRDWITHWASPLPPPEVRERVRRAEAWVQQLPIAEARRLACHVIETPSWFDCEAGDAGATLPERIPPTVREFYGRYRAVSGRSCALTLAAADVAPSEGRPHFLRIGWADEQVELCVMGEDDRVHEFGPDVAAGQDSESSVPSIFHLIVRMAAILEYVPLPEPPTAP